MKYAKYILVDFFSFFFSKTRTYIKFSYINFSIYHLAELALNLFVRNYF